MEHDKHSVGKSITLKYWLSPSNELWHEREDHTGLVRRNYGFKRATLKEVMGYVS